MSLFDDSPPSPPEENFPAKPSSDEPAEPASSERFDQPLGGDPLSCVSVTSGSAVPTPNLPEDLRISWSWPHLLVFVIFVTNILWFALIFLFLYVTLAVLRDSPFWRSLGWKKLKSDPAGGQGRPWMYFLSGCGLSIFVVIASSRVKDADHVPIQEFFKNRAGALSLMAMAVLIAPLVEETVFRGYLYPVLARITSAVLQFFGMEFCSATRTGVVASILMTGMLFGLMHAPQLGWTWGLVSLLTLVGVIFTFARAWTGTVLASFLLHLGYNSMIALASIVATKGFTHMPPSH